MIPILTTEQVRECDRHTIEHLPIASIDLMERACMAFVRWYLDRFDESNRVSVVCGPGNNGGDGMGVARLLLESGADVEVFQIPSEKYSKDLAINRERFGLSDIKEFDPDSPDLQGDILIDAIFGSGISREPEGIYAQAITAINASEAVVISIDVPSGLFTETPTMGLAVQADYTVSFQVPKIGILLPENGNFVGEWDLVDIGLMPEAVELQHTRSFLITDEDAAIAWPVREKYDHKGTFGHILIAGGSKGKMGAVILSGLASLRAGSGLTTLCIPDKGLEVVQTSLPEAMAITANDGLYELGALPAIETYDAIGCGPGMGTDERAVSFLRDLLNQQPLNLILDADALNILSGNRELLSILPANTIITPHPGEFRRLAGEWKDDFQKLDMLREFSGKYGVITILKGAHTLISTPGGELFFNSTGNPGMGTAGSGDVLTGILASLAGQLHDPILTAILGVYIHGLAGDLAAQELSEEAMISSDIIEYLPVAIRAVQGV